MRQAFAHDQLDMMFPAELLLGRSETVGVHEEDVGLQRLHFRLEIHDAAAPVDPGVLHTAERFDHIKPFRLGIDGLPVFQCEDGLVGTESDVKIAQFRRFLKESDMAAVKHVVATAYKNFFRHDPTTFI